MNESKIAIVKKNDTDRNHLKNLLIKESFQVFDFKNSMNAILWIKKNGSPRALIIEENAAPLDAYKSIAYLREELNMNFPIFISSTSSSVQIEEVSALFIAEPFTKNSVLKIKDYAESELIYSGNEPQVLSFSLEYLEHTYDGNQEMIHETLAIFQNSVEEKLKEIQHFLDHDNHEEVRNVAHNIKPSFEMITNKKGTEICNALAHECSREEIPKLVKTLNKEFVQIKKELKNYFSQNSIKIPL